MYITRFVIKIEKQSVSACGCCCEVTLTLIIVIEMPVVNKKTETLNLPI